MHQWKAQTIMELASEYQEVMKELTESYQVKMNELQQVMLGQAVGSDIPAQTSTPETNLSVVKEKLQYENVPEFEKEQEFKGYPEGFWQGDFCHLDRELTIYDGDRDKAIALLEDKSFVQAVEEIEKNIEDFNYKKDLLKTSFHLTRALAPNVYKIADECKEKLGLKIELDFYVYHDQYYNAFVYPPNDDKLFIILTSSLLESFEEDELSFVIGHEIGHYLFNHFRWNPSQIFSFAHKDIKPSHCVTLYQWKRDAEITADRVGLICCESFDAAAKSFFKLSSGVKNQDTLDFHLQSYLEQFVDLKAEIENDGTDIQDLYTSHPFGPLRVKALEIFSKSETYYDLIGQKDKGEYSELEMENHIEEFMNLMVPKYLNDNSEQSKLIQKLLFWAGLDVAEANGVVEEAEIEALKSIVSEEIYQEENPKYEDLDRERYSLAYYGSQYAHEVLTFADKITCHNIIRDICLIALADGTLDEQEKYVIQNIAYALHVDPQFVDEVLNGAAIDFN